jgi:hypothetical protein
MRTETKLSVTLSRQVNIAFKTSFRAVKLELMKSFSNNHPLRSTDQAMVLEP